MAYVYLAIKVDGKLVIRFAALTRRKSPAQNKLRFRHPRLCRLRVPVCVCVCVCVCVFIFFSIHAYSIHTHMTYKGKAPHATECTQECVGSLLVYVCVCMWHTCLCMYV